MLLKVRKRVRHAKLAHSHSPKIHYIQNFIIVHFSNSPSVLDRLNALVEPDGVLAVDERGAVGDEGVMTIVPHPNFR